MPELPEVETIVRELQHTIIGKSIAKFSVHDSKRLKKPRLSYPQKIISVSRRGKYLILKTDKTMQCVMHLRMTGELLYEDSRFTKQDSRKYEPHKHERAMFVFSDGSVLRFIDTRRFGTIGWIPEGREIKNLGAEPLSREFTPEYFSRKLEKSSRKIKSALLDQAIVAGVGNIYADESLWHSGIHPARKSCTLLMEEIASLITSVQKVLREGIAKGGFTLRDYRRIDGSFGYYQKSRKVYGREGERCKKCRGIIKRMVIVGRSSYFCPQCQG